MQARQHSVPPTLQQATTDPGLRQRLLDTHRHVWVSLLWGHCSFLLGPGAHKLFCVCALQESVSLVPCKFWGFFGGVNGDLLQEGLCHTQVCCTQRPCSRPLLTCTSTGDTQIQFRLRLCGLGMSFMPFPGMSSSGEQVLLASALSQEGRAS